MNLNYVVDGVLIAFGVAILAIGAVVYVVQFRQGLRADASKKWPRAPGSITASSLEPAPDSRWRYRAVIRYTYRVGAKDYHSDRIFWGGNEGWRKHMTSVVADYPADAPIRAYYDPKNPAEAVLDPIQKVGSRPLVLYAIGLIALGLFASTFGIYVLTR